MIVWGGGSEHRFYNDGGIYDPIRDEWQAQLAPALWGKLRFEAP